MIVYIIIRTSKFDENLEFYHWLLNLTILAKIQTLCVS